jgi:signal transduction histidine kinase
MGRIFLALTATTPVAAAPNTFHTTDVPNDTALITEATNHLGHWIWAAQTRDKQTVRLWRAFDIPRGAAVKRATLWITADNGYQLFLDGREIGQGSDWRWLTKYDLTALLSPGRHVLAVSAFNDALAAGLLLGLRIELANHQVIELVSDGSWRVVPETARGWTRQRTAAPDWPPATVVGDMNQSPWVHWPMGIVTAPSLQRIQTHFWQTGWFQLTLLAVCTLALLFCLWLAAQLAAQARAQRILQEERVRIARDIHDDLGAQLTQLVLQGEVAQQEQPPDSPARAQFNQLCERAREISRALGEVVWAVNSRRDTVRDFASYVCKYAQTFLANTPIRCRLDVEPEIPPLAFDLPVRRNLFLAVKEALNNAARQSGADELFLRIHRGDETLMVVVEDNGHGFDPSQASGNGLANMRQRLSEIGGTCHVVSQPGAGCVVTFTAPLGRGKSRMRFRPRERTRPVPS